jgi:hypothetical protein
MDESVKKKRRWMKSAAALAVFLFILHPSSFILPGAAGASENNCLTCHRKESGRAGQVVAIYERSTHGKAGVSCAGCHGGDSSQTEKSQAHAVNFVARPDANETLARCGVCHRQPLALFKGSRHFPAHRGVPRLDCAECHGAHSVGSPPASFSWASFCAGCHGLEYLPALPDPFQSLLALSDEVHSAASQLEEKGRAPSNETMQRRREFRRLISEIVHPTDLKGGLERIPHLMQLGQTLKQQIELEKKK